MMRISYARAKRMHRRLCLLIAANVAIPLGFGCSSRPKQTTVAVTPVSAAKPAGPNLIHAQATVGDAGDQIAFTVELPPAWTWSDGQAEKIISASQTIV